METQLRVATARVLLKAHSTWANAGSVPTIDPRVCRSVHGSCKAVRAYLPAYLPTLNTRHQRDVNATHIPTISHSCVEHLRLPTLHLALRKLRADVSSPTTAFTYEHRSRPTSPRSTQRSSLYSSCVCTLDNTVAERMKPAFL